MCWLFKQVSSFTVHHPRPGAVYWLGPVEVDARIDLAGPGIQGLDVEGILICAETELSWPVSDWSRSCISMNQGDPATPLLFGTTIGVVTGTVSLWDARPNCGYPQDPPAGGRRMRMMHMAGDTASPAKRRMKFKIIHHQSSLDRRGKPLGLPPLGRGTNP
ncbi:unnamed protein product, partial [Discosporangium mesarthrocarpum]